MRVARVIRVLNRRRDWIVERIATAHVHSRTWLEEEKRAIENAIPILEAELQRRHVALMDQRMGTDETERAGVPAEQT